jgi:tetratricopeptide (TPR) repeat protein
MRRLLRDLYGRTNDDLGFPPEAPANPLADELSDRLVVASRVDAEAIDLFRQQVDAVRQADRRFGSAFKLEQLRGHIEEVEHLLRHSLLNRHRQPLATLLTEASTLAGWNALDGGLIDSAWRYYTRGREAAAESGSISRLAHATAEQAYVLLEVGDTRHALDLLGEARSIAGDRTPRLLRAWLAAAAGEAHAMAGDRDAAHRAFDDANTLLPTEARHPDLPFIFLGGRHLDRWRGNALVHLGEPEAIDQLTAALDFAEKHPTFVRANANMYIDLALAHAAAGERDAALTYAQQARRIVQQLGSARLRRRLERLLLPPAAA